MRRGNLWPEGPDQDRHGTEQTGLRRDRYRDRHAEGDDFPEYAQPRRRDAREDLQWLVARIERYVAHDDEHDDPHRDRARQPATDNPHRGCSEVPVHQHVIQKYVAHERDDRRVHDRPCVPDAFGRKTQREEDEHRRRAERDGLYVADGHVPEGDVDADLRQQGVDEVLRNEYQRHRDADADIDALTRVPADHRLIAGAEKARRDRRYCHQQAHGKNEAEKPDAAANGNRRKSLGAQAAGHDSVRELHACNG